MANALSPIFKPLADTWNYYTSDQILDGVTQYKKEWHTKFLQSERLRLNEEYNEAHKRFYQEPELTTVFKDNWARFSVLAFAERLIVVRQAHGFLRNRFEFASSTSGGLNAVRSQGLLNGALRGNLLNALHFTLVFYHPLVLAKGDVTKFLAYSAAFETLAFPLDTIKTLIYADVNRSYTSVWSLLKRNFETRGFDMLYRGLPFKLVYNVFFGANLAAIGTDSNLVYLTTPLWLLSYGLLTLKTRHQVADTTLSTRLGEDPRTILTRTLRGEGIRGLYAGLIPFALVNLAFAWSLPQLFSEHKKERLISDIISKKPSDAREVNWASY